MTREDILAMPAGRELDALVAEKVMGWREGEFANGRWYAAENGVITHSPRSKDQWRPSTDISTAWEVVEKMNKDERFNLALEWYPQEQGWGADFDEWSVNCQVCAKTAPEAVVKAALIAILEETP